MTLKNFIIVLIYLLSDLVFSQSSKSFIKTRDSLLLLPNDSVKVDQLIVFCKQNDDEHFIEVLELSKKVEKLTNDLKLFKRKAKLYNTIGDIHFTKANYIESFKYYSEAYRLSDSIKSKFHLAMSAYNLGWQAAIQQKNYKDVSYIYFALGIGQELKSDAIILRTQNALGSFYTDKYDREHKVADFDSAAKDFVVSIALLKYFAAESKSATLCSRSYLSV